MFIPGFIVPGGVGQPVLPSLQTPLMRLFRNGDKFNMMVLAVSRLTVQALSLLPCYTAIKLVALLLRLPQFRPMRGPLQCQQHEIFMHFTRSRHDLFARDPVRIKIYTAIRAVITKFGTEQTDRGSLGHQMGWKMGKYSAPQYIVDAMATFLLEITLAPSGWESIATE
jgi:hypothetical protein